jgi:predicted transcriptional regulator of viral defense system
MKQLFAGSALRRSRELEAAGFSRMQLLQAVAVGAIERVSRGLYRLPDAPVTESHSLAIAAKRVPNGIVCLQSALRFHKLTTQSPHEVWMALPVKGWQPNTQGQPIRFVWFSGPALTEGIERHRIDGVDVKAYSVAKTIADCFKYRKKIGIDIAIVALREARRERRCTTDEIMEFARICRVANVVRPYLESLT